MQTFNSFTRARLRLCAEENDKTESYRTTSEPIAMLAVLAVTTTENTGLDADFDMFILTIYKFKCLKDLIKL